MSFRPSKLAIRSLFGAYWGPGGWKRSEDRSQDDETRAVVEAAGIPTQVVSETHDEAIARLTCIKDAITLREAASCFAESLGTRRLELRSLLSSVIVALGMPPHRFDEARSPCPLCGSYANVRHELGVLAFEKLKWGGVRLLDPVYAWMDIAYFTPDPVVAVDDGRARLRNVLHHLESLPPETTSAKAAPTLRELLPGNTSEREIVLDILGIAGVLQTPDHQGFWPSFQPYSMRAAPPVRFDERQYPVGWWRARNGVNWNAAGEVFGLTR